MTHIVGGYPSLEESEALALSMAETGVSFIEIQIPFSDPVADGPTIMAANKASLDRGTTPDDCFELMKRIKSKVGNLPMLFMTYYNILFAYGLDRFCRAAKDAGAYGLIVPDIPIDEENHEGYLRACKEHDLHAIQIVSPLTTEERMKEIAAVASGFIYCVSIKGKTGARKDLDTSSIQYLDRLRKYTALPLALGFGISTREHVIHALTKGDIAVIGSKVLQVYDESGPKKGQEEVKKFLNEMIWP